MATEIRRSSHSVVENLRDEPWRFEFFEAVRLLHLIQQLDSKFFDAGNLTPLNFLTYRTNLSLNFPASEIQELVLIERDFDGIPIISSSTMTVNFIGLTGPSGTLPRHYTELLLTRRLRYKDEVAHKFFDLFNHRVISLLVKAWEKYRFYISYERDNSQHFTRYLLDLVGMGTNGLQRRLEGAGKGIKDEVLAYYSGLNAQQPHSAIALEAILRDYFQVAVQVMQFQGCWLRLEPDQCTRIGKKGTYHKLGESAVIGSAVWDHQSKFRICIGPLGKQLFDAFLPIGNAFEALKKYIDWFKPMGQSYDVQLILKKEEVPRCCLGGDKSIRLGWSTWLKSKPFDHNAADTILMS